MQMNTLLACPRDKTSLYRHDDSFICAKEHNYPIVAGVPIFLLDDVEPTYTEYSNSLDPGKRAFEVEQGDRCQRELNDKVDAYVSAVLGASNGALYKSLINNLPSYPIPRIPLLEGNGKRLLDVGCMWGRWSIAAARLGYQVLGIDASFGGILAARRVAHQLGISNAQFIVADARYLPFNDGSFDAVFSYSVIQHFSKEDARRTLDEIGRALKEGGESLVQMPNRYGLHNLLHLARRGFAEGESFNVRYYSPDELKREFSRRIGPTEIFVDGFFALNAQVNDIKMLPLMERSIVRTSEALRRASNIFTSLHYAADSLWLRSKAQS